VNKWGSSNDLVLVNGVQLPVLSVPALRWQRLRLVLAGDTLWMNVGFGTCEVAVLAKDGIYIKDSPRFVSRVPLAPGSRADIVIRCPAGMSGQAREHQVVAHKGSGGMKSFAGVIFTIQALGTSDDLGLAEKLLPWSPPSQPAYLRDLTGVKTPECSCTTELGIAGGTKAINGHLFEGPTAYMHRSPINAVIERHLVGLDKHPYHQHTFPFQLTTAPEGDPYHKIGDWHDTYLNVHNSTLTIRFHTVDFSGPLVVHCHHLSHNDLGMLAVELVEGSSGDSCACDLLNSQMELAAGKPSLSHDNLLVGIAAFAFVATLMLFAYSGLQLAQVCRQASNGAYLALDA